MTKHQCYYDVEFTTKGYHAWCTNKGRIFNYVSAVKRANDLCKKRPDWDVRIVRKSYDKVVWESK